MVYIYVTSKIGDLTEWERLMLKLSHFVCITTICTFLLSCGLNRTTSIEVNPEKALIDEPISVRILSCPDDQPVMLRATVVDDDSVEWVSENIFMPKNGFVDLTTAAPTSGSYVSPDAMGFIWSMVPADTNTAVLFSSKNLTPLTVNLQVYIENSLVVSTEITRLRIKEGIQRTEIRDNGLVGTLFIPKGTVQLPAIIDLSGSGGGMSETRAALLASHGYISLSLAYFGMESLPETLTNISLEYFRKAIEFLQQQERVNPKNIGIIGRSRGGELALLLGATYPQIKCVIGYVPGIYRCPGDRGPAWILNDEPLPFISSSGDEKVMAEIQRSIASGEATSFLPMFTSIINDPSAIKGTEIPIENINGSILLISGQDDQLWPSATMSEIAIDRLTTEGFEFEYKHLSYPNAGHYIGTPFKPTSISEAKHPVNGVFMKLGGTPEGNAYANMDSWQQVLKFLKESFKNDE
jgi:dienelactone hydrolase